MTRRAFLALSLAAQLRAELRPITIGVRVMFDRGAHGGQGLSAGEIALFWTHQEKARHEFAASGIVFDIDVKAGAYLRKQGYSEIPQEFLVSNRINLFVTDSLGYDVDKDHTGGSSVGGRRFYKTYLGLREAGPNTLLHEYAHHFCGDTKTSRDAAGNFWADLRNDYWLWRQRHGAIIPEFRACAGAEWARYT